jgi:uncharacterized membrane protein YbaN (DUF454 family)
MLRAQVIKRMLWASLGWCALALAALGAVLPLLPTTPFVLVAAFAFGRGSPRVRGWLLQHRVFGAIILDWEANGAIARKYKWIAATAMVVMWGIGLFAGLPTYALALQAVCMLAAGVYVWTRPDAAV